MAPVTHWWMHLNRPNIHSNIHWKPNEGVEESAQDSDCFIRGHWNIFQCCQGKLQFLSFSSWMAFSSFPHALHLCVWSMTLTVISLKLHLVWRYLRRKLILRDKSLKDVDSISSPDHSLHHCVQQYFNSTISSCWRATKQTNSSLGWIYYASQSVERSWLILWSNDFCCRDTKLCGGGWSHIIVIPLNQALHHQARYLRIWW